MFICARSLTLSPIEMLLLTSVHDLLPLIILVSKGRLAREANPLFIRAAISNRIDQVAVVYWTGAGTSLQCGLLWGSPCSHSKVYLLITAWLVQYLFLRANRKGSNPGNVTLLKETLALPHRKKLLPKPFAVWIRIVNHAWRVFSLREHCKLSRWRYLGPLSDWDGRSILNSRINAFGSEARRDVVVTWSCRT